jgi:argininosuccinate lyase
VQKGDLSLTTLEAAANDLNSGVSLVKKGLTQAKIDRVLDPEYSISVRKAPGAPAPVAVKGAIHDRKKQLTVDSALVDQKLTKLARAKEDMLSKARRLVA